MVIGRFGQSKQTALIWGWHLVPCRDQGSGVAIGVVATNRPARCEMSPSALENGITAPPRRHILTHPAARPFERGDPYAPATMKAHYRPIRHKLLWMLAIAGIAASGCALDQLPRIDPTGQRLLVFPGEPTPAIAPLPQVAAPTLPPGATSSTIAAPTNVVAPPVYTDPFLPGGPGASSTDLLGRPVVVGPPVASTTGQPVGGVAVAATPPGEALSITPSRVLAPVGSEVILIGGVCAENGYLRTNERIEWMLDRAGTGQIVTVGGRGELDIGRLPRNTPRKVDNYYAIGATSPYRDVLDRGTADPNDDVEIRRGDAWITVSSPTEGTSYVTAYAPDVPSWAGRTARATIYWVDAQWAFPPSVTLAPGESHTLTTTITRQTDGSPVAGWIVRYRVAGGTAGLGYDQGQTSDVPTDNLGRASVSITPTDDRPGTTNIEIEVIRPEQAGVASSPRVTLGRGATSITWAAGGISGTPMPVAPPSTFPPVDSAPITPPVDDWRSPSTTPSPTPAPTPTAGTPDLVVQIEQQSSGPFRVGDTVDYLVTVLNQGDGTARNVNIVDEFDIGLETDIANPGEQVFKSDTPFDLGPGESQTLPPIQFRITQAGRLSHSVTASADNATPRSERAFLTVEGAGTFGGAAPSLRVAIVGPMRRNVGDVAEFRITVENIGDVPARNVVVSTTRDPELKPVGTDPNKAYDEAEFTRTGTIRWVTPEIAPRSTETYLFSCECLVAIASACARAEVTADGLAAVEQKEHCLEIRQRLGDSGITAPPLDGAPPATPPVGGLDVTITEQSAPRVGDRFIVFVQLKNNTGAEQRNVQMRVLVPPVLKGDYNQVQSTAATQTEPWGEYGTALLVGPIASLPAAGEYQIALPVDAIQQGTGKIIADASSSTVQPKAMEREIQVLPR